MKSVLILTLIVAISTMSRSAIDPYYAEVMERGFEIEGDSVVFPDGSKCLIDDFNTGECGKKWFDMDYCVPEGKHVWNNDKCCDGLKPYLGKGRDGQPTCQKAEKADTEEGGSDKSWYEKLLSNSMFWIGLLIPLAFIGYLAFSVKRRIKK